MESQSELAQSQPQEHIIDENKTCMERACSVENNTEEECSDVRPPTKEELAREIDILRNIGVSYTDIAAKLGVTRGRVAGIVYNRRRRLVVEHRQFGGGDDNSLVARLVRKKERVAFPPRRLPKMRKAAVEPLNLTFIELHEDACRWPYGDETPYTFCGHARSFCSPYCSAHTRLAWECISAEETKCK